MKTFRITSRRVPTNYTPTERWEIGEADIAKRLHVKYRGHSSQDIAFTDKEWGRGVAIFCIEEQLDSGEWAIHYEKTGVYPKHFSKTLLGILPDERKPVYAD